MNHQTLSLAPGLTFVATPIGSARDITLRALDVLASADVLAAEDTRSLRRLMDIHAVPLGERRIIAYHDHSPQRVLDQLMQALADGQSLAYASEAGMPLISDPGYELGRAAQAAGHKVTVAPGASAVPTALALAGLPTDAFYFAGFLPSARTARRKRLTEMRDIAGTLITFESPKRVAATLQDMVDVLGPARDAALCRELTKKFEEVRRAPLADLAAQIADQPPKGEIVLLVDRARLPIVRDCDLEIDLKAALTRMSVRDAADLMVDQHGVARRRAYQLALKLEKDMS